MFCIHLHLIASVCHSVYNCRISSLTSYEGGAVIAIVYMLVIATIRLDTAYCYSHYILCLYFVFCILGCNEFGCGQYLYLVKCIL